MAYKRKKRKVPKARSAAQKQAEEAKSFSRVDRALPKDAESLIISNGNLVEELLGSDVWKNIVEPLFIERVASVSGRFTNGRWIHGSLTRSQTNSEYLSGYQRALMDIRNDIGDFVIERDRMKERKADEEFQKSQPIYNPFLEELDETKFEQ